MKTNKIFILIVLMVLAGVVPMAEADYVKIGLDAHFDDWALVGKVSDPVGDDLLDNDIVEVADALCDIQYVLAGAILEFGLGEKFSELFDEVQRSNMSKSCSSREEAEATVVHYLEDHDTICHVEESDGHFLVYRTEDQKTIKSIHYSPADLKSILGKE